MSLCSQKVILKKLKSTTRFKAQNLELEKKVQMLQELSAYTGYDET